MAAASTAASVRPPTPRGARWGHFAGLAALQRRQAGVREGTCGTSNCFVFGFCVCLLFSRRGYRAVSSRLTLRKRTFISRPISSTVTVCGRPASSRQLARPSMLRSRSPVGVYSPLTKDPAAEAKQGRHGARHTIAGPAAGLAGGRGAASCGETWRQRLLEGGQLPGSCLAAAHRTAPSPGQRKTGCRSGPAPSVETWPGQAGRREASQEE
jgi:hypothetical protein